MKSGFLVIGVCLLLSTGLAFQQYRAFKTDLVATQDVQLGLLYFMEANDGRLPASEAEFRASPFLQTGPDGALRVVPPAKSRYIREPHGYPLRDLSRFQIAWGVDPLTLKPDEYGRLADSAGQTVELMRWPSSGDSGKVYSALLYDEAAKLRNARLLESRRSN
jgi:hypothetical protein